jgi:TolB protein
MRKNSPIIAMVFVFVIIMTGCGSLPFGQPQRLASVDIFWDTALLLNVNRMTDDGLAKSWARVSPDGTRLLYTESTRNVQRTDYSNLYNYWNIMLLRDVNSPAKTPMLDEHAYAPSWYENSSDFVFAVNERGGSRIVRSAIGGGGRTYISRYPLGVGDTRPVVRGDTILCDAEINGRRQILSMKDNGMEVTVLGEGHSPFWHPILNKFLFIRNGNIFEMDLENIQVTQLYSDPNYNCAMPSYSPNGEYIIFQKGAEQKTVSVVSQAGRILRVSSQTRWQIFIVRADGTGLSSLTVPDVDSWSPSWDVNNLIYFVSSASGSTEIYRARINFE